MMKIYDEVIREEMKLLETGDAIAAPVSLQISSKISWSDDGDNAIIFRSDMAYELGGGILPAISSQTMTEDPKLVPEDRILLCGPDLNKMSGDAPYARLTYLRVKGDALGDGDKLYNNIRKIDYTKYHVHPHGYMSRISAANHREPVRISKSALADGLSFEIVGNAYLSAYKQHPQVEAVKIIFITDPAFDYKKLEELSLKAEQITGALDHIFKDLKMDCHTCNLKEVCDEVEGLRELHFQNQN